MESTTTNETAGTVKRDSGRVSELKALDDPKAGVKGLVDAGVAKIPSSFHYPPDKFGKASNLGNTKHVIPVIDLSGVGKDPSSHQEIVSKIREVSESWGFFLAINHGIPVSILEDMKDGVRRFHEQDVEVKKELYTVDFMSPFGFTNNSYSSPVLNWRDSFHCYLAPSPPKPEEMPKVCRDTLLEYGKHVMKLGISVFELLSEALGLHPDHLKGMGCAEVLLALGHYYPACPEPELAMGSSGHSDDSFVTVILQDHMGGLQALFQDEWIDVPPMPGTLVVIIGGLLQLITNDIFKACEHRVLANRIGPRVSAACLFTFKSSPKLHEPIKELLSEDNPPKYRGTTFTEYGARFEASGFEGKTTLQHFSI